MSGCLRCWSGLLPHVDLDIALHWGEFVAVSAAMEHRGVPINMEIARQLQDKDAWAYVRDAIVPRINPQYGVYVQDAAGNWSFSTALFEAYCVRAGISWPRHEGSNKLDLRSKTFDSMAKAYPETEPLRQLRHARNKMRRVKLAIGADGRNRTVLWPFVSKTGRSQPKASEWIFSPAVWLRSLIKPGPGRAIAYIDWSANGIPDCGGAVRLPADARSVCQRQPVHRICQAVRRSSARRRPRNPIRTFTSATRSAVSARSTACST